VVPSSRADKAHCKQQLGDGLEWPPGAYLPRVAQGFARPLRGLIAQAPRADRWPPLAGCGALVKPRFPLRLHRASPSYDLRERAPITRPQLATVLWRNQPRLLAIAQHVAPSHRVASFGPAGAAPLAIGWRAHGRSWCPWPACQIHATQHRPATGHPQGHARLHWAIA